MSTIPERLEKLRAKMQEKGIDIYIIPTADFHQSEYVGEHFKAREYITGFTGSAGTAVVSKTEARLWTDGRYFIQAAKQLEGTTVELMKMGQPGVHSAFNSCHYLILLLSFLPNLRDMVKLSSCSLHL